MRTLLAPALLIAASTAPAFADAAGDCFDTALTNADRIAACTQAVAEAPDMDAQSRALMERGALHYAAEDLASAQADFLALITMMPGEYEPFHNLFLIADINAEFTQAREWAAASRDAEPDNINAHNAILSMDTRHDIPGNCAASMERVLALLPESPDLWASAEVNDPWLFANLGRCLDVHDRPEEALVAFQAAYTNGLNNAWLHASIAYMAFYAYEDEITVEASARAVAMGEDSVHLIAITAESLVALDRLDDAIALAAQHDAAIDAAPSDEGLHNVLAWALFLADRFDEAQQMMNDWQVWADARAGELNDYAHTGNAWDTIAHIRAAMGDTAGAGQAWHRAFETYETRDDARALYREELSELGIDVGEGDAAILAGLTACAAMGPACRMIPGQ